MVNLAEIPWVHKARNMLGVDPVLDAVAEAEARRWQAEDPSPENSVALDLEALKIAIAPRAESILKQLLALDEDKRNLIAFRLRYPHSATELEVRSDDP